MPVAYLAPLAGVNTRASAKEGSRARLGYPPKLVPSRFANTCQGTPRDGDRLIDGVDSIGRQGMLGGLGAPKNEPRVLKYLAMP